jgi:TonB family protein
LALLVVFVPAGPAVGAEPFADWSRELESAIRELEAGETAPAMRRLDGLLEEYAARAGSGPANQKNLGTLLLYRAIALQQGGRIEDAQWDWDLAAIFLPQAGSFDLSRFGEAGRALSAYAVGVGRTEPDPCASGDTVRETSQRAPGLKEPRVLKRVRPQYPPGARQLGGQGAVEVAAVIGETGAVARPRALGETPYPSLTYAALRSLREWRFEPATLNGRPVESCFSLTVRFRPGSNESPPRFRSVAGAG